MQKRFLFGWVATLFMVGSSLAQLKIPEVSLPPRLSDFANMAPPAGREAEFMKITDFIQRDPRDGQPATQRTEVYVCHDAEALYVVFVAFDSERDGIRARMVPREQIFDDDSVNIMIDTFNDQRRGYTFAATPRGIQWDALFTEGSGFDSSFNAVWKSEGKLTDEGFLVWMAIPFRSLRFPRSDDQTWRVMFNRTIERSDEESFWPRYTNRIQGRLNQAQEVALSGNIKAGRNWQLVPYGAFRSFRLLDENGPEGARYVSEDADTDVGLDAKFVFRDSLVLDLAVNPDFSQVESDEPQITVNQRFEVFFPERRPFFLENADLFQTPLNLVFTRRIADPKVGGRFTGKTGPWSFGLLAMDDEAPGKRLAADDPAAGESAHFGVFRMRRDIFKQSNIGFLMTHRDFADQKNQVFSLDGRILWDENWNSTWQVVHANTDREEETIRDQAINLTLNRSGRKLNHHFHYVEVGPEFRTQTGFLGNRRPDTRNFHTRPSYRFRPEGKRLLSWGPNFLLERVWDHEGLRLDDQFFTQVEWEFAGNTEIEVGRSWAKERLRPGDLRGLNQQLDFSYQRTELGIETEWHSQWSIEVEMAVGSAPNFEPVEGQLPELADERELGLEFTWRPISRLRFNQDFLFSELEDRDTSQRIFRNRIYRTRVNWQFSRPLSVRLIMQHEAVDSDPDLTELERERNWNGDVLLTYLVNPWTALYAGYNSNYSNFELIEDEGRRRAISTRNRLNEDAHQFFVKFSYLWR